MIKLISNYAKRLGLPGYSSHQFSVSVEAELSDAGDIQGEVERQYRLLQESVDSEIQKTGFVPDSNYGTAHTPQNRENPQHNRVQNLAGFTGSNGGDSYACSDKQLELIHKLQAENNISQEAVDALAYQRFDKSLKELNKLEASGLISELLETTGKSNGGRNGGKVVARKGGAQ